MLKQSRNVPRCHQIFRILLRTRKARNESSEPLVTRKEQNDWTIFITRRHDHKNNADDDDADKNNEDADDNEDDDDADNDNDDRRLLR